MLTCQSSRDGLFASFMPAAQCRLKANKFCMLRFHRGHLKGVNREYVWHILYSWIQGKATQTAGNAISALCWGHPH